jgi:hypothetical protein
MVKVGFFSMGKWAKNEANLSLLYSPQVKNVWSYTLHNTCCYISMETHSGTQGGCSVASDRQCLAGEHNSSSSWTECSRLPSLESVPCSPETRTTVVRTMDSLLPRILSKLKAVVLLAPHTQNSDSYKEQKHDSLPRQWHQWMNAAQT